MSTYTQTLYQVVFSTKHRIPCMTPNNQRRLYRYFYGALIKRKCFCFRINGVEDHVHLLFSLHSSVSLATIVKEIKGAGTYIIKEENLFKDFRGWQIGYGAFTYDQNAKYNLIKYIINQEEHHKKEDFIPEFKRLLRQHKIPFDPKFLE